MNRLLVLVFLFLLPFSLLAQLRNGGRNQAAANVKMSSTSPKTDTTFNKIGVSFSSGFMYSNWAGNSFYSSYISPEINYSFTNKFNMSFGLVLNNHPNLYSNKFFDNNSIMMRQTNSFLLYYGAEYYVKDNFRLSGVTVFNLGNEFEKDGLQSANFALDYKFDNGFTIRAEMNYFNSNQYNPYFSPYGIANPFYYGTFYHDPFGRMNHNNPFTW